jgi:hypothetical protein
MRRTFVVAEAIGLLVIAGWLGSAVVSLPALASGAPDVNLSAATVQGWQVFGRTPAKLRRLYGRAIFVRTTASIVRRTYRLRSGRTFDVLFRRMGPSEPGRAASIVLRDPGLRDLRLGRFLSSVGPSFGSNANRATGGVLRELTQYACRADIGCFGTMGRQGAQWHLNYGLDLQKRPYVTVYIGS